MYNYGVSLSSCQAQALIVSNSRQVFINKVKTESTNNITYSLHKEQQSAES